MEYNRSPISLREGVIYIDGVLVADSVSFTLTWTPDVWNGRLLGDRSTSSRWLGYSVTGEIVRRRSTPFLDEKIAEYAASGQTPEMTIQGIMNDTNSDYYAEHGIITKTAVGCVLTSGFTLISLQSDGQVLDDTISFNARDVK